MTKKAASISDVAAAAGVSIMTVSRAIRGVEGVSAAKRNEIVRLAKRLRYRPNRNAISLAVAHSNLIGISIPTLFNDVFADILEGMRRTFDHAGFDTVIDTSDYDPDREEAWVERMLDWRTAGVILCGVQHNHGVRRMLNEANMPTLEIWDRTDDPIDICLGIDHEIAGRMLGAHLVAVGYRRPCFASGVAGRDLRAEKRIAGLRAEFKKAGVDIQKIETIDLPSSFEAGMVATFNIIETSKVRPDVICYLNDHMAFGGLTTCEKLGLRVPEDIGIVGFNGLGINSVLTKRLTTIVTPRRQMGSLGAKALLARLKGVRVAPSPALPTQLFVGDTTRKAGPTRKRRASIRS